MRKHNMLPVGILASIALPMTTLGYSENAHANTPVASDASTSIGAGDTGEIELSKVVTDADDNIKFSLTDLDPSTSDNEDELTTADGEWSVGTRGKVKFRPVEGFGGVATISYTVSDDDGNVSNVANLSVSVVNPVPVATDGSTSIGAGAEAEIDLVELVTDPDDNIKFSLTDLDPATSDNEDELTTTDGEWSAGTRGKVKFRPVEGFSGIATISYTVSDDEGNVSNIANLSVSVVNPVPVATDGSTSIGAGGEAEFNLVELVTDPDDNIEFSLTDLDPATSANEDELTTADGEWSAGTRGKVKFRPVDGFSGVATVSYTVSDDEGNVSNIANLSVNAVNPVPVATNGSATIGAGGEAEFNLVELVTDPDDNIEFSLTDLDPSTSANEDELTTADGKWTAGTRGKVRFRPVDGFSGVATVSYTVSDDEGNVSNIANLSVNAANPVPVATDGSTTIGAGDVAEIELSELVTDTDDNIMFTTTDFDPSTSDIDDSLNTADGEWSVGSTGKVRFRPVDAFNGVSTVTYAVSDREGNVSNVANLSVNVVNPVPVAADVAVAATADEIAVIELSEHVTDSDDNIMFTTTDFDPSTSDIDDNLNTADGEWSVGSTGKVRFRPVDGFSGVAAVSYVVADREGNVSNVASLSVSVAGTDTTAESSEGGSENTDAEGSDTEESANSENTTPENQNAESTKEPTTPDSGTDTTPDNTTTENTDTDADGLPDSIEGNGDADGDGVPDFRDEDSDGDGIADSIEAAANGEFPADVDGDSVFDYLDVDSDNDGISDAVEGANDRDADGIANFRDLDVDNDGIFDIVEARIGMVDVARLDADLNGVIDLTFTTGPNGMADTVETAAESGTENYTLTDVDRDGIADYRDQDSDNDGLLDTLESDHTDLDLDGTIDDADASATAGIDRTVAAVATTGLLPGAGGAPRNTDADGLADFRDGDSDNDGITDVAESFGAALDANGDGRVDNFIDADGNGVDDAAEAAAAMPTDTNGDGVFDAVQVDSDSDGISDLLEAGGIDANGDGVVDGFQDDDADGIDDGINALPLVPIDTDNDSLPDFQDTDSDNDGLSDIVESGGTDADGDGKADSLVGALADTNNDGTPDHLQNEPAVGEVLTGLTGAAGCSTGGTGTDPLLPGMLFLSSLWAVCRLRRR